MPRTLQLTFLTLFFAMLGYGGWLYWRVFAESGFGGRMQWVGHAPLGISNAYEQEFTRNLSEEHHPLVTGLAALKWQALDVPFIRKVEKGREGWLFLKEEVPGRNELLQSLGIRPYLAFEEKMWQLIFAQRAAWTKAQGMEYVLVVAPNKTSIYPEYLPPRYHVAGPGNVGGLLKKLSGITVIDLTPGILQQKQTGRLFHKTDTHWNELGAFVAYQTLLRALPKGFGEPPLSLDSVTLNWTTDPPGDLARLLLLDSILHEKAPHLSLHHPQAKCIIGCDAPFEPGMPVRHFRNPQARLPRVFFDHDSFFKLVAPFLAEHFQETIFSWKWQGFDDQAILKTQPDLVIDEFVERSLIGDRPRNSPPVLQHYWQQHFSSLPQMAQFSTKNLRQAFRQIETQPTGKDELPVIALELTPTTATRLIVEYDDKEVAYPLEGAKKNTIYLEWERTRVKDLRLEEKGEVAVFVKAGKY